MEFSIFVEWAFYALISLISLYAVKILSKMNVSIEKLNLSVAQIIVKHEWHDSEITDIKKRIIRLENNQT